MTALPGRTQLHRWGLTSQVVLRIHTLCTSAGYRTGVYPTPQAAANAAPGHGVHAAASDPVMGHTLHLLAAHLWTQRTLSCRTTGRAVL